MARHVVAILARRFRDGDYVRHASKKHPVRLAICVRRKLAPYYDRVEWELGVSGDARSPAGLSTPRVHDYPMPAMPSDEAREHFTSAAKRLGWQTSPIPFSINSTPHDGRPACVRCSQCVGHACPVNAKNGTHNTFIPRALATGNCDLLMSAQVLEIEHNGHGLATGIRMMVELNGKPTIRRIWATHVVVAAGAIETARLLLASGFNNPWIGRNHHSHGVAMALASTAPYLNPYVGPGHSVATVSHMHQNRSAWGGGVIFDYAPPLPAEKAEFGRLLSGAQFGLTHKEWMRESPNLVGAMSMVQEIPHQDARVTIDWTLRDRFGMPAARLTGRPHPATHEAVAYMADQCVTWMTEIGGGGIIRI